MYSILYSRTCKSGYEYNGCESERINFIRRVLNLTKDGIQVGRRDAVPGGLSSNSRHPNSPSHPMLSVLSSSFETSYDCQSPHQAAARPRSAYAGVSLMGPYGSH